MKSLRHSKIYFFALGIAMLWGSACTPSEQSSTSDSSSAKVIRLGLQPNEDVNELGIFEKQLEKLSGLDVEITISKNYEDLVVSFKEGKIDFAFFSPINFIEAEKHADAKVLLKKVYGDSEFYYSAIIVKEDSSIKTLRDLDGKKIAFVDPNSTSGYLYPMSMLYKAFEGEEKCTHEFLGKHSAAVKALAEGKFDAAAVWADSPESGSGAWSGVEGAKFKVLQYSDPIPNDAFVVRGKYYQQHADVVFKVMESLISMSDSENNALKKVFDTDKMTTATSTHYDSVRKMLERSKSHDH